MNKKMKVTKRPNPRGDYVLQPTWLRMFLIYIVLFILAIGLGTLLRLAFSRENLGSWFTENWDTTLAIIVGGAALLALIERGRWTLRVLDGRRLEGPSGAFGERFEFPVEQIDWERTNRSLGSWLKIGNAIYSQDRRRIAISQWFFDPGRLQTLIELIRPRGR